MRTIKLVKGKKGALILNLIKTCAFCGLAKKAQNLNFCLLLRYLKIFNGFINQRSSKP